MTYVNGSLFKATVTDTLGVYFKLSRAMVAKTQFIAFGYYAPISYTTIPTSTRVRAEKQNTEPYVENTYFAS